MFDHTVGIEAIPVRPTASFFNPVDVGSLVAHNAVVVGADFVHPHVINPDDQDVGFSGGQSRADDQTISASAVNANIDHDFL